MKEWNLSELKKGYEPLAKKYKLPSFEKLNEEFDIERIAEKETDFILREIRKAVADKIIAYIRFLELLMNPSTGPMFFFMIVKGLSANDKSLIDSTYKRIVKFEIEVIPLDNSYSEKKEAEFISKIYKDWQEIKEDINKIVEIIKENWEKQDKKEDKEYFG
jgi:hypothetical protein